MNTFSVDAKLVCVVILLLLEVCSCLECYACKDQPDNDGKCKTTVQLCTDKQDACLSEIRWGSVPFWELGAKMQYFISKNCSTKEDCYSVRNQLMPLCDRIEWKDWKCAECCQGDRCNYYVTLGAPARHVPIFVILSFSNFVLFLWSLDLF